VTARRFALAALLALATSAPAALVTDVTLQHGGVTRWFDYYEPAGLTSDPVPLLLVLHGGTQSNKWIEIQPFREFMALADVEKFLIVFPNGTTSSGQSGANGQFNWNDCRNDAGAASTPADDVGFLRAVIDWMAAHFAVNPGRVYVTGPSNGGMMAYRLALELSHRIAAVAAVIANLPLNSECRAAPVHPLSVLVMNGTADAIMPWNGGQVAGNRGAVTSATATAAFWRTFLQTGATPEHVDFPDLDAADGGTVSRDRWTGGTQGTEVMLYTVTGGGHQIPSIAHPALPVAEDLFGKQNNDVEASAEIWTFLARQRLSPGCD
jgi:polyhydroxybutyrate depolymerase